MSVDGLGRHSLSWSCSIPESRDYGLLSVTCEQVSEFSSGLIPVTEEEAFLLFSVATSVSSGVETFC